ncbi:MAG: hypothetical protein PV362_04785 [Providencia heimbachae]|nr:hypothetical protein [Providencia heimbachae]
MISSFFLFENNYFSHENFIYSLFRATFGVLIGLLIPLWLQTEKDKYSIIQALKKIITLHVFIQFLFIILFFIRFKDTFNLIPHGNQYHRGEWFNIYDYTGYYRFGGIFEEPSWFCWFMIFSLGIIISYERINHVKLISNRMFFFVFLSFVATFSISGLISFFILVLIKYKLISLSTKTLISSIAFLLLIIIVYLQFNDSSFLERISLIITGNDGSSNNRILGYLFKSHYVLNNSLLGTGLGNSVQGIEYYSSIERVYFDNSISNQNGFIEPFISTGIICGSIYIWPILSLAFNKKTIYIFITISLVFFTTSAIFNSTIWFFIFLAYYINKPSNTNLTKFSTNY